MEYDEILTVLTSFEKGFDCDNIINEIISKALPILTENDKELMEKRWSDLSDENNVTKSKYLLLLLFVVEAIKKSNLKNEDETFSVKQMQTLKTSMEIITLLGLKPNCILYDKTLNDSSLKEMLQRFERLVYIINFFIGCFDDFVTKTCILPHLGSILTSMIFIAHVVITPPKSEKLSTKSDDMSPELYDKLMNTQKEFKIKFSQTMQKCPVTLVMKELMIIHGTAKFPKCIRVPAQKYLIQLIIQPNGVISLVSTMCNEEEATNLSNHWHNLEIAANLVATSHGNDADGYYNSVCSQLIQLLKTDKFIQGTSIAKVCIKALHEYNPKICFEKVINKIAAPFLQVTTNTNSKNIIWRQQQVTESIDILAKCFVNEESEFKNLSTAMLIPIVLPIFHLYIKSVNSISSLRHKVKQLVLKIFTMDKIRDELFSLFLIHQVKFSHNYGAKLHFQLGDCGDFEIVDDNEEIDQDEFANALYELVEEDKNISFELFKFLLKSMSPSKKSSEKILETNSDVIDRMSKQLSSVSLLIRLANLSDVQRRNSEDPEPLLSFVKSLIQNSKNTNSESDDMQMDAGYIGLMLVKQILDENEKSVNSSPFEEFISFLNQQKVSNTVPSTLKKLIDEITKLVRTKKIFQKKKYEDLSINKEKSDYIKALEDLADPLLPVRAHGLISLTKLIEKGDPETLEKKDYLICILQENLKDEDSFVYIAAINGLCALTLRYPQIVIEMLIQEFINMPQKLSHYEISVENRVKLGEILVKATRDLGKMAYAHKTPLINGFLCAARDSDPLICASSLSCIGELCKILGFRLGTITEEIIYCIECIIKTRKEPECRRAAVLVITLLFRGLGKDILTSISHHLKNIYRSLKYLRDNDNDDVIRLHAQLALEEIDDIVTNQLFVKPKLEKKIFLNLS